MATRVLFEVRRGDGPVKQLEFAQPEIRIGRAPNSDVRLEDKKASRHHGTVELADDGRVTVVDAASTGGTFVNNKRVERQVLADGDVVTMGETKLRVRIVAALDHAAAHATTGPSDVPGSPAARASEAAAQATAASPAAVAVAARPAAPAAPAAAAPAPRAPARPAVGAAHDVPAPAVGSERALEVRALWQGEAIEVRHYRTGPDVRVGESQACDFVMAADALPAPVFPLVEIDGSAFQLNFVEGWQGHIVAGGRMDLLSDLVSTSRATRHESVERTFTIELAPDARAEVNAGDLTFALRFVEATAPPVPPLWDRVNYHWVNIVLLSMFVHACVVTSLMLFPTDTLQMQDSLLSKESAFARFVLEPQKEDRKKYLERLRSELKSAKQTEKFKSAEGKTGTEKAPPDQNKRMAAKAIDPNDKRIAQGSGLLKLLAGQGAPAGLNKLFEEGGLGGDLESALGSIQGAQIGDSQGFGGMGFRGAGSGGGGRSNSIGLAQLGTLGRAGGDGSYGEGVGGLGQKKEKEIKIASGRPVVMGALDRELIKKVIDRHRSQIRYCYEKQLTRDPNLYGKIAIKFVIAGDGKVTSADIDETTMNNRDVEECITRRVRQWLFPKPKGGGIVVVTYPFVFKV